MRLVSRNSGIRWKTHWVCVTHTLAGEYIGLEEVGDGLWDVYFGSCKLGRMNERRLKIEDHKGRWVRKEVSPMFPVNSVTYLPGCTDPGRDAGRTSARAIEMAGAYPTCARVGSTPGRPGSYTARVQSDGRPSCQAENR
jgi:hypothetical protein